ncbi:MAG: UDP-glucose 4-epimerase GalE [Geminicoccales bacterium]
MSDTILVTGGAGYVGSHCCKLLAAAGYTPVVYDNFSSGHLDFVKWGPLVEGDIRNVSALSQAISFYRPIAVMHFAALSLVGQSVLEPADYWDVNVNGVRTLLEAMRNNACDKIVFSSTCAVYGDPDTLPISEETPIAPLSPYGMSKHAAEMMMQSYDRAYGIRSARLRYFNACGGDPDGEIGERHDPETHLIPLVLGAVSGQRGPVTVFGRDYPTRDGTAIRDYIHVNDLALAHLAAISYLQNGHDSLAVNLGTGMGHSVADIIAAVERVTGQSVPFHDAPRRDGDPACLVASPQLAAELLGWRPIDSDLDQVIADAWHWHCSGKQTSAPHRNLNLELVDSE